MILFTKLLLAHLLGDFLFQPLKWVIHKEAKKIASGYLYLHILLHFALTMILLWDLKAWKIAAIIAVSHYLIDLAKLYSTDLFRSKSLPFILDQLAHIAVLYCVAFYPNLKEYTSELLQQLDWTLITAYVFVSFPSGIIMGKLLQPMSDQISLDHKSLPNAGKTIGIMERLFVLTFVILDHWEAIGLLIAAKSVFRFNDLKDSNNRKLTEYILIGTLVSFGFAMATGIVYNWLS